MNSALCDTGVLRGSSSHLGATIFPGGVNFSVFARDCTGVELLLFDRVDETIEKLSLERTKRAVKVLPSVLGDRAVSVGAASVALREVFLDA